MAERIRVLWLAKGLGQGGMENLLVNHARVGDWSQFEYHVGYCVNRPFHVIDELEAAGVRVHQLGGGSGSPVRCQWDLVRLLRHTKFHVVHTHSPLVAAAVRPVTRLMFPRSALISTEHNGWSNYRPVTQWANGLTCRLDHHRFAVSDEAASSPPAWTGPRAEVLIHGVDVAGVGQLLAERAAVRAELGIGPDQPVVGMVANFRVAKAYPVMLAAARQVLDAQPDTVFVSMGQGPLEAEIHAEHDRLGLGDSFRFLGFRSDATRVMAGFDVFALSSDIEGLPVSVMDAKALGLPVVATAVGGLPAAVVDGTEGLLVPPQSPGPLADALLRVIGDTVLRHTLADGSARSAGRYDARVAVARQEQVYRELVR